MTTLCSIKYFYILFITLRLHELDRVYRPWADVWRMPHWSFFFLSFFFFFLNYINEKSPEGSHTTPIGTDWVSDKILGKVKWYYYQYLRVVLILHETEKLAWFWNYPLLHYVTWSPKFESKSVTDGREAEGEISKRKDLKQTFVVGQWVGRGLTIKYT